MIRVQDMTRDELQSFLLIYMGAAAHVMTTKDQLDCIRIAENYALKRPESAIKPPSCMDPEVNHAENR